MGTATRTRPARPDTTPTERGNGGGFLTGFGLAVAGFLALGVLAMVTENVFGGAFKTVLMVLAVVVVALAAGVPRNVTPARKLGAVVGALLLVVGYVVAFMVAWANA